MNTLEKGKHRLNKLAELGELFSRISDNKATAEWEQILYRAECENPWFTRKNLLTAFKSWSVSLELKKLLNWTARYEDFFTVEARKLAIIMAGNIPMVGLHDLISAWLCGHKVIAKLSTQDTVLMEAVIDFLNQSDHAEKVLIEKGMLDAFDAVIATGSDNSSRYFDYYFGKYPHIIRKNRSSIAVLSGKETEKELALLSEDVFNYFGLGCRSIAGLLVPRDFSPESLFKPFSAFDHIAAHNKYANNYDYRKSVKIINKEAYWDNGFLLIYEGDPLNSYPACMTFQYYDEMLEAEQYIQEHNEQLQCVVSSCLNNPLQLDFGASQYPELWDYADNVDTIEFLSALKR